MSGARAVLKRWLERWFPDVIDAVWAEGYDSGLAVGRMGARQSEQRAVDWRKRALDAEALLDKIASAPIPEIGYAPHGEVTYHFETADALLASLSDAPPSERSGE